MCVYVFMLVRVCELLSWWETGRERMCMAGLQLNHWGPCLNHGHLTTPTVTEQKQPCGNNECHADSVWIPFVFWHHDTWVATLVAIFELLAHAVREHENITAVWIKGPRRDGRGKVHKYVYVSTRDTVIYYIWTMCLDSFSILHFWTMEASIWDSWDADSRQCCWRLMENHHICLAACQRLPAVLFHLLWVWTSPLHIILSL